MKTILTVIHFIFITQAYAWGFFAHQKINELAVFTVPKPLFAFYKHYIKYIGVHAADPDRRRGLVEGEAAKHFLDCDRYEHSLPLDTLLHNFKDASSFYGTDTLNAHGVLPWNLDLVLYRLTEAFRAKDIEKIIKLSSDLGHYVGDLHVPLHTTSNYNGQKTGQRGIHALWESRLPELFYDEYDLITGQAIYYASFSDSVWKVLGESHLLSDTVLLFEKKVSLNFKDEDKFSWEKRGNLSVKVYSKPFCRSYHRALGNMVEDRMRAAIFMLGSLWYSCWVNAGQPDLEHMPFPDIPEEKPADDKSIKDVHNGEE